MVSLFDDTVSSNSVTKSYFGQRIDYLWVAIIVIAIIAILVYIYYKPKAEDVAVMGPFALHGASTTPVKDSVKTIFTQEQIRNNLGNNFTLSFFVYMDDANRERIPLGGPEGDFRFKTFLTILGVGTIVLDPLHQVARLSIRSLRPGNIGEDSIINIPNFMISRWNQLTFTIEGRTVDVYVNGVLAKSTLLPNLPVLYPVGVLLETSPDFSGQTGLFQAWPRRLTADDIARNYKRNTDTRGKPLIPDEAPDIWGAFKGSFCDIFGICGVQIKAGPTQYIDYEFA